MGRGTLGGVWEGSATHGEVRDGSGAPRTSLSDPDPSRTSTRIP